MAKTVFARIKNMVLKDKYENELEVSDYGGAVAGGYVNDIDGKPGAKVRPFTATMNGTFTPSEGEAYGPVTVDVPSPQIVDLEAFANGGYDAPEGQAYGHVDVAVPVKEEQVKSIEVTENGELRITPDDGKALSDVLVNVNVQGQKFDGVILLNPTSVFEWRTDKSAIIGAGDRPTYKNLTKRPCVILLSYLSLVSVSVDGYDSTHDKYLGFTLPNGLNIYYIPNSSLDITSCGYLPEFKTISIAVTMSDGKTYKATLMGTSDMEREYPDIDIYNNPAPASLYGPQQMEVDE